MTPTDELREELREMLGEEIPAGGTEADTLFTNAQIDRLLTNAATLNAAAAEGWIRKAAKLTQRLGEIEQYSVGDETYKKVNLQTAIRTAQDMAETYARKAGLNLGALILKLQSPEVL